MNETLHYLDEVGRRVSITLPMKPVSRIDVSATYVTVWNEDRTDTAMTVPMSRVLLIRTEPA